MVGGGQGAFIGAVHRLAARLDGELELVCGAFSRDPANTRQTAAALGIDATRAYADFEDMMKAEAELPTAERMEFVAIVTPNHMHFPVARAALEAGFHVLSDKPATLTFVEAKELAKLLEAKPDLAYGLTHTYLGHPMVREMRAIVADGGIGAVRKVFVEYIQGWLAEPVEGKQADWRTDPARSGAAGAIGDIGTHAHNLAEFVTGQAIESVAADLTAFVDGRRLDDDGSALFRMSGGAKGVLNASQICVGRENSLSIRVFGETGGLEWHQEDPNTVLRHYIDKPTEVLRAATPFLHDATAELFRTPAGHPEGYIEAFANIYLEFARALRDGGGVSAGIDGALRGMAFIDAMVTSSVDEGAWTEIKV